MDLPYYGILKMNASDYQSEDRYGISLQTLIRAVNPALIEAPIEQLFLSMINPVPDEWDEEPWGEEERRLLEGTLTNFESRKNIALRLGEYNPKKGFLSNRRVSLYGLYNNKEHDSVHFNKPLEQRLIDYPGLIKIEEFDGLSSGSFYLQFKGDCTMCWQSLAQQSTSRSQT